jgi:3-dehydroquinate synthase II/3-amino-4-hydroxybenzoic acid synthase
MLDRGRASELSTRSLWFDTAGLSRPDDASAIFARVARSSYTGALLHPDNVEAFSAVLPPRMTRVFQPTSAADLARAPEPAVIAASDIGLLDAAAERGMETCLRASVHDADSLLHALEAGKRHQYLSVRFTDPTNIPLELLIASLQASEVRLLKELADPTAVDDAIVTLGVMEVGADGVIFSPRDHAVLDAFESRLRALDRSRLELEPATIVRTAPIGMGHRSCIDTVSLFSEREGLLVGSTSQGAILCCAEVFYLPYMEKRPFRVNAGAVHSYVYSLDDRTDYMSELRAGAPVMIVDCDGGTRRSAVGRIKTEVRPLRLIEAELAGGAAISVILQDDWHVRVFSSEGLPLSITELTPGTRVLAHLAKPGRHVGIAVDEQIIET